ncbi:MAG: LytTR family DNA-binding domain-containing protein [Cyclobacteriaceae bacterium]
MKVTGLIIEDEKLTAERLESLVHTYTEVDIIERLYSVKSAVKWLQKNELPQIIFLDIQLGDGTGFDILREIDSWPHVIFTTAFDQYALEAFKYNSLDYLLKPVKPEELKNAVEKLYRIKRNPDMSDMMDQLDARLFKKYKRKFLVKSGLKFKSVSTEQISCFYSKESCTYLRSDEGQSWIIDHTLDELQSLLDPQNFFRVNRHVLINEGKISSIDSYFNSRLLVGIDPPFEEDIVVSREKVKQFKSWLDE